MSVFGLSPSKQLDESNITTLLSWCDELCMSKAFDACHSFFLEEVIKPATERLLKKHSKSKQAQLVEAFYTLLDVCIQYNFNDCLNCARKGLTICARGQARDAFVQTR